MRALVLSGGGVKGAYQVGALRRIICEQGVEYDAYCGISVGSINAAFLSQYATSRDGWQALSSAWNEVKQSRIEKGWGWFWSLLARIWKPLAYLPALWKPSVFDSRPLQSWIRSGISFDKISKSTKKLRVVSVCWDTGEPYVADEHHQNIADWVIGSSAFPVMFTSVKINDRLWTDGGLRSVTPLGEAIKLGADEIDVIMCSSEHDMGPCIPREAVPSLATRAIEIMSDQIMVADLRLCGLKNDLVELRPDYKKVHVRILRPTLALEADSLDFSPRTVQLLEDAGYKDAARGWQELSSSRTQS